MPKKLKGTLATPIKPRRPGLLMDEADIREQTAKWAKEDHQKLLLLCEHYGINPEPVSASTFYDLALRLARDFVPGFQEERPKGRKNKWHMGVKGALVVEIERLVRLGDEAHGVSWAAGVLAKKEPWKSFLADSEDPAALIRRFYYEFNGDPFAEISSNSFRYYELNGNLEEWEQRVIKMYEEKLI